MDQQKNKSVAVNFLYNMIYQISLVILPLITSPYLSRIIGPEGLGNYSYSYSVAYYFYLIAMLGINNYGNRSIAAVRGNQNKINITFSRIYYFQLFTSCTASLAYLLYCILICNTNKTLAFAQMFYVLSSTISVNWFFFGVEEFRLTVIRKTAIKIITTILIFVFVRSIDDLLLYTVILACAELLGEIYLWFYIPKYVKFQKVHLSEIFSGWKEIFILFFPVIATSIYRYMDKIMLGKLSGMEEVGQYDYAEKIIMICLGCMTALGTVMLPKMSNLIALKKNEEVRRYLSNSMQFAMLMGSAISFGLGAVGNRLAIVYFGSNYALCGSALTLLAVTVLPIAWANVIRTQYLIPSSKDKEYLLSVIVGAALNFIINFLLIPKYGLYGAVVGTIVAEFSVAIIQTLQVRKELEIKSFVSNSITYLIFGLVMFIITTIVGYISNDNIMGLLLQVAFGGITYIVLVGSYSYIKKNFIYDFLCGKIKWRK